MRVCVRGRRHFCRVEVFGAKTHFLKRVRQEVLDFGLDRGALEDGVVRGGW
jgi:hypothetical protein